MRILNTDFTFVSNEYSFEKALIMDRHGFPEIQICTDKRVERLDKCLTSRMIYQNGIEKAGTG